ncbi:MFS transporter [Ornithinimicrobium sp. INDO-MA30-4]|nr:MFS transporter [Ornithinimicrobium sp. INDO-MA30-4]UJH69657.1 MFS transporter [Ornithinimicrobium sp. INDO-MA30-4]
MAATFSGRERGIAFGVFGAVTGVATALGPVLGGVLTTGLSWRWIFWVNLPICIGAILVVVFKVDESRDPNAGKPDWIGFVTFSAALALLVYGLIEAGIRGWTDSLILACLAGSAVLLGLFVVSQAKQKQSMFDLSLLRKPTFVGGLIAAFAVSASIFSLLAYLVIYLQNVLGYSAVEAGVRLLFLSGASFIAATVAGRLTSKVPTKWLIAPGFAILGVGLSLLLLITPESTWSVLIPGLLVCGVAIGMINVPLASTAVGVVATERAGMASRPTQRSAKSASPPASQPWAPSLVVLSRSTSVTNWPAPRRPVKPIRFQPLSPAGRLNGSCRWHQMEQRT